MKDTKRELFEKYATWKEFETHIKQFGFQGEIPYVYTRVRDDDLLTPLDVSEMTGYSEETIRRWCRTWKLKTTTGRPPYKVAGVDIKDLLFQWTREELMKILEESLE